MNTINTIYKSQKDLQEFILKNDILKEKNILLQIFTAILDEIFIKNLILSVRKVLPQVKIVGTTTDGEIFGDDVLSGSTVLSFSTFEDTQIETFIAQNKQTNFDCANTLIKQFPRDKKPKVAISFADGLMVNGENYLKVFEEYDKRLVIAGGLAGDNATFTKTLVFTENGIVQNGAVIALLYNDNLVVNTKASFGWESLDKKLTITKSSENIVYEIDGIKAVDIYKKYLGDEVASALPQTGIEFPLMIQRNGIKIPRAVVGKNSDGSLVFAGNIAQGEEVTFGYGNVNIILNGEKKVYEKIVSKPVESIFIYSCMARKALLGDSIKNELYLLNQLAPLSGFFTYGEFFKNNFLQNGSFLNQTMTVLALSESNKIKNHKVKFKLFQEENKTLKALSHLINQTTKEVELANSMLEKRVKEEVEKNKKLYQDDLEHKKYLDTVIESNDNAIIAIDKTGTILTYNKKAQEIFGYTKEEMLGSKNLLKIIPQKYKELHTKASENYFKTGKTKGIINTTIEIEAVRKDGIEIPIRISFGASESKENRIVVSNIADITKEKEKEKQLLHQSRLAQMGEMIGMIAHQWRQPLTAISSSANTLALDIMMDNYNKEFFEEQINHIAEYSQHLSSTIDDFRNFFKQKKQKQKFTIEEIVDNTMSIIGSSLDNKGIVLEKDFQANKEIESYPNELKQVVLNLIKNAEDILLEKEIKNPWIKIKTFVEDDKVVLTVADNAGGVPEDIKDKIFDPYFSTKLEKDGTGLGLYMSKTIIDEHCKGKLSVSNNEFGAVFRVELEVSNGK